MNEPRPTTISARPREMRSSVANSWNRRTGSAALRTATALVKRMRFVRAAAAARITAGAESRNSLRWCSPIPNTSRPTWSACSISSRRSRRRSAGLTAMLVSPIAAAKLSTPISISHSKQGLGSDCSRDALARSVGLENFRRRLVGAEWLDPLTARAHERERFFGRPRGRIALEVEVEHVVPRRCPARTRLDLAELKPRGRERLKRTHQRAGQVRRLVHEAGLGRTLTERRGNERADLAIRLRGDREEPREVVGRRLDRVREHLESIALGCAPACDRRDRGVVRLRDLGRRARRVECDLRLDPVLAEEVFDLRERLRV